MTTFDQIAAKIIKEQELIIGPVAWSEAGKVEGIHIDVSTHTLTIDNPDGRIVIDGLVREYERFFGRAAREVCKDAVSALLADLPASEVPSSLQ